LIRVALYGFTELKKVRECHICIHTKLIQLSSLTYGILKIHKIMYGNGWGGQNIPVP